MPDNILDEGELPQNPKKRNLFEFTKITNILFHGLTIGQSVLPLKNVYAEYGRLLNHTLTGIATIDGIISITTLATLIGATVDGAEWIEKAAKSGVKNFMDSKKGGQAVKNLENRKPPQDPSRGR